MFTFYILGYKNGTNFMTTIHENPRKRVPTINSKVTVSQLRSTPAVLPLLTKPPNIQKLETSLDPNKEEERALRKRQEIHKFEETLGSLDMEKSYEPLFELLWYGQMPCSDVREITSREKDELSFIKRCYWKNKPIRCNSIFQKRPTDRGMCCSFNIEKAESILKEGKYTHSISARQKEEAKNGFEKDERPTWYVDNNEPISESGHGKGLKLIFDGH